MDVDRALLADLSDALFARYAGIRTDRFKRQGADGAAYRVIHDELTDQEIRAHVAGDETIAMFYTRDDGSTCVADIDVDWPDKTSPDTGALATAAGRLRDSLREAAIPCLISSSGRRGYHLTVFVSAEGIPADTMRAVLSSLIRQSDIESLGVAVEVFPKESSAAQGDTKLPCGIHRATGNRCALLDGNLDPLPVEAWAAALRAVPAVTASALVALASTTAPVAPPPQHVTAPPAPHPEADFDRLRQRCPRIADIFGDAHRPHGVWLAALSLAAQFAGVTPRRWADDLTENYHGPARDTRNRDAATVERLFANPLVPTCENLGCPGAGARCRFRRKDGKSPSPLRHLTERESERRIRVEPVLHEPVRRSGKPVDDVRREMGAAASTFANDPAMAGRVLPVTVPPGVGKTTMLRNGALVSGARLDVVAPRHAPYEEDAAAWAGANFRHIRGRNANNCANLAEYNLRRMARQSFCPDRCAHKKGCAATGYLAQFANLGVLAGTIMTLPHWRDEKVPDTAVAALDDVSVAHLLDRVALDRAALDALARDQNLPDPDHRFARALRDSMTGDASDSELLERLGRAEACNGGELADILPRVSSLSYDLRRLANAVAAYANAHARRPDAVASIALSPKAVHAYLPPAFPQSIGAQRVLWLGASLDPALLTDVLPAGLTIEPPVIARVAWDKNVAVVQYADNWHGAGDVAPMLGTGSPETVAAKRRSLARIVETIHGHAESLCVPLDEIGIITHSGLEEYLRERVGTARSAHFGAVASSNELENLRLLAIVGTLMPPTDDVRRMAAALWPDLRPDEVEVTRRHVPFPGTDLSVSVIGFAGDRPDRLLRSLREEEMYQAVHRLRPHLPDVQRRAILLFSSLPLPKVPAEVRFLDDKTRERIRRIRTAARIVRGCAMGDTPSQAEVRRQLAAGGEHLSHDAMQRIWDDVLHAACTADGRSGTVTRACITDIKPPCVAAPDPVPSAHRGLMAENHRRAQGSYEHALAAAARLDEQGTPVTVSSLARELGISKQSASANKGIRHLLAERGAPKEEAGT